jgi:methionyl aminopeptidase
VAIQLKTRAQIDKLREVNLLVADVLDTLEASAAAGMSTWELDSIAATRLKQLKGESAFLGYRGYPAVLCTSVNDVVVHGIPRKDVVLKEGDLLSIDFGAFKDGWCGDSARTLAIGKVPVQGSSTIDAEAVTQPDLDRFSHLSRCRFRSRRKHRRLRFTFPFRPRLKPQVRLCLNRRFLAGLSRRSRLGFGLLL